MTEFLLSHGVTSYVTQRVLIVPFQADFYQEVIAAMRQDILAQLHANPAIIGLVIDLSGVKLIDLANINMLEQTLSMASVLGVTGFLVGIQPSVTMALIALGYDPSSLNTALTIEQAILLIHQAHRSVEMLENEVLEEESMIEEDESIEEPEE